MNRLNKLSFFLVFVPSLAFILLIYFDVFLQPNNYLFSNNGDAIKNYFTYASHIKESSWVNFSMMNYPYGENSLYLDCHPLFTIIIKFLSFPFPGIISYSIGILNFIMIISLILTSLFIYHILLELKITPSLAAISAFCISILAPQVFRMTGHMALSYSFFFPMNWLLMIKFAKSCRKLKWSAIILINILAWFFIHAYLGMMLVSFTLTFFLVEFILFERKKYFRIKQWIYICFQSIIPLLLFWLFLYFTDNHVGRTKNPYGFLVYTADFSSVLLPHHPPLKAFFEQFLKSDPNWEGLSYIGIGSSISILLLSVFLIISIIRYKSGFKTGEKMLHRHMITAFIASILLLFTAMGYPFVLNLEYLLDYIPIVKNFRAIGRFSWIFFFVICIGSVYFVDLMTKNKKRKVLYFFLSLLLPLSYFVEGFSYHKANSKEITRSPNLFNKEQLDVNISEGLRFMDYEKYQAIIPLPFFHIGSENYGKSATDKIYRLSMVLSYHSDIPILGNYSVRTSIPESKNLIQILSPNFYQKQVEKDLKNQKPFLILYSHDELSEYEYLLLSKCKKLYSNNEYSLYMITRDVLFKDTSRDEIRNFERIRKDLQFKSGFYISSYDTSSVLVYQTFEDKKEEIRFRGQGSITGEIKNYNLLAKIQPNTFLDYHTYILSFWMYNQGINYGQDALNSLIIIQSEKGENIKKWIVLANPANSVVINGSWSLIEVEFIIKNEENTISVYLKGDDDSKKTFYIDELLIREKGINVYCIVSEKNDQVLELLKNNHQIKWQ